MFTQFSIKRIMIYIFDINDWKLNFAHEEILLLSCILKKDNHNISVGMKGAALLLVRLEK
jgi:hypothetical protein